MSKINVRKVQGKTIAHTYKVVPYPSIEDLLKQDGQAFVEGIERRTAWAAAKILSKRLGFPVRAEKRLMLIKEEADTIDKYLEGYLFLKDARERTS